MVVISDGEALSGKKLVRCVEARDDQACPFSRISPSQFVSSLQTVPLGISPRIWLRGRNGEIHQMSRKRTLQQKPRESWFKFNLFTGLNFHINNTNIA